MIKAPEDNYLDIYKEEYKNLEIDFDTLRKEEDNKYTFNGIVLDECGKVTHDLTSIRIHMIDFGFDEFDSESYQYIKDEIERCRSDLDEGRFKEAAVRVVCMQLLIGLEINLKTVVSMISANKIGLPEEFYGDVPQRMLKQLIDNLDESQKKLLSIFKKDDGSGSLKMKRGK